MTRLQWFWLTLLCFGLMLLLFNACSLPGSPWHDCCETQEGCMFTGHAGCIGTLPFGG